MPKRDESDRAADLLERLLTDARFRAAFRRNPAAVARKYELDDLAEELSSKGKAMYTLEIRESRSSLAGVLMAAAAEGFDASDLTASAGAGHLDTPAHVAVTRALSRVNLEAVSSTEVPGSGGAGGGDGVADALAHTTGSGDGNVSSAADAASLAPSAPPLEPAASAGGAAPAGPAGAQGMHEEFGGLSGPSAGPAAHGTFGGLAAVEQGQPRAPAAAEAVQPAAVPAQPAGAVAVDASTAVPEAPVGFPGGAAGNQALVDALLKDPNVTVSPDVQQELLSGAVDSRVPALLEALSAQGHKLELSAIDAGHNGFDVSAVNGSPVDAANMDARDVATALLSLE